MVRCGFYECMDYNARCCWSDVARQEICCRGYYVYEYWWFWVLWVVFFVLLLTCSLAFYCLRRRRRMRYVMLGTSGQPAYGSVIVHQNTSAGPRPSAQLASAAYLSVHPSAPAAPPAYTLEQEKPPAYSQF